MTEHISNGKFQSTPTGYQDKHGNKLASKLPMPSNNDDTEDDESGGGNGKGKLGTYKLENLLKEIGKGTFKAAKDFGNYLNKHGLDESEIKKSELSKEVEHQTEKTTAEDRNTKTSEDSQNVRALTTQAEAKSSEIGINEKQAVRYGLFGENTSNSDHQGKVIQTNIGFDAEKRALEGLQGSAATGSITNAAAGYLGNALGTAKQSGAVAGRFNILNNTADRSAYANAHNVAAAEVQKVSNKSLGRKGH